MEAELYSGGPPGSRRTIIARADAAAFLIEPGEIDEDVRAFWGDSDYELWVSVPRDQWGALLVALAREFLSGDAGATDRSRAICAKHGVRHEGGSWV